MNDLGHPRVFANTSRPASPSYTDLQSVQTLEFDNFLYQEAVSYMTQYNTQREIVFYPGENQLDPWNEGEVRCQQFNITKALIFFFFAWTVLKQITR